MKRQKMLSIVLAIALVFVFAGCKQQGNVSNAPTEDEETVHANWPRFLSMATGSSGGTAFVAGSVLCQLISDNTPSTATAQVTTGGGQSIELTRSGECEVGLADQSIAIQALNGTDSFDGKPYKGLRAVCNIYTMYWQQLVATASHIETIPELVGYTTVVGGPGSGTEASTRQVYAAHGLNIDDDIKGEFVGIAAGVELVQNRQASGITAITPVPFASFVELTLTDTARLIPMDDDAIEEMTGRDSPWSAAVIPAGTYRNQTNDIHTVTVPYLMVVDEDADEQLVYELVKLIYDNVDYLKEQNAAFKEMSLDTACEAITIELHPGAERFFKEQGILN